MKKYISVFFSVVFLLIIISISFYSGLTYGSQVLPEKGLNSFRQNSSIPEDIDLEPFWKVWNLIENRYVNGNFIDDQEFISITNEEKVWGMIQGLLYSLNDPYTIFLPPEEKKQFEEDVISGSFGGVGIEIGIRDRQLTVISPLVGSPAHQAGIMAGDKIMAVNDESTYGWTSDQAVRKIRGEVGTIVKLTILRENEEERLVFDIKRDTINIPVMDTKFLEDDIYLISLYNFSAQSPSYFRQAAREFLKSGSNKMIIDLRGNAGGFLEASIDISSLFLPAGRTILREVKRDPGQEKIYHSYGYNVFGSDLKLVILINGGSASASEIMAGALAEHQIATLIGEQTFGKGSVQELVSITDDTSLKFTIARWLTPNGHSISKEGLKPHIEVEMTHEHWEKGQDPQLEAAIEYLKN
ncbi:MAG TPA: PDZ domain-containing protein [Candidatus Atribacteria bacterium]|nr:PDZ domain-containing protein [Candidatus Atribacteria bacterium]